MDFLEGGGRTLTKKRAEGWRQHISNGADAYVLRDNENIIGVVEVSAFRDEISQYKSCCEIPVLYLEPNHIGRGLGQKLLLHAERVVQNNGVQGVALWVLEKNQLAIGFYKRNSYVFSGESKVHNTGLVEHLYIKSA